jgi:PAS domain S-box-containing protein
MDHHAQQTQDNHVARWLVAAAALLCALALRWMLGPLLAEQMPYMLFATAAMLSAWYGGAWPGLLTMVAGLVLGNLFFVHPRFQLKLDNVPQLISASAYIALTSVAVLVCESLRRARRRADMLAIHSEANAENLRREIASRTVAEDLLSQSENRYRFLAESIPQIVWTARADGVTNYNNKWMFDYFGKCPEEMQKLGWTPFRHPDDRGEATTRWQHSINTGEPYECMYRLLRGSDQSWRWHLARAVPMHNEAGRVVMWFGTCTDIDDRKRAEDALRASEAEFRAVFELAGSGKALVDPQTGRFIRVNRKLCEITGYEAEELLEKTFSQITHQGDREWSAQYAGLLFRGELPVYAAEKRYVRKDGATIWVHVTATMINDAQGRPLRAAGVIQDITQRKLAEEALREREEFFRTMGEAVPDFVWSADTAGRPLYVNRRWEQYTGLTLEQLIERGWRSVHHPDEPEVARNYLAESAQQGEPAPFECRYRRFDGSFRWFMGRTAAVRDTDGNVIRWVGTLTDIDDRKRIEAELQFANRAKDQFLATLSHELRTPLTPVLLALDSLGDDASLSPQVRTDLEMIRRNVGLETKLIDDLLDITRIARGKLELRPQVLDMNELLVHAVRSCCGVDARQKSLEIILRLDAPNAMIRADPHRMDQVFFNLLRNAVKFTPPGGRVEVATTSSREGFVRATISDNGIGIEPGALDRIFNAFEQGGTAVTRRFGGLGLGLAVSRALVELHGGTIQAQSAGADHGATFVIDIPRTALEIAAERRVRAASSSGPQRAQPEKLKILLVEDHDQTAQILARLLRATNYSVLAAADVSSAMRLAETDQFDLVVSDLGLPDGSGLELMTHLRQRYGLRGIALTGFGMEEDVTHSRAAGFSEHLVKPVSFSDLQAAIARVTGA